MPLAANLDEADQIIDAAEKKGVRLMPSLTFRFTPTFVKIKEMIRQGAIGEPTSVMYREFIPAKELAKQWPPGCWVWDLETSGGPLFTLSVWSIDLIRWMFDTEVTEVGSAIKYTKLAQFGGTMGYDCHAAVKLANGISGGFQFSGTVNSAGSSCVLEVVGDSTATLKANENKSVLLLGDDPIKTEWDVFQSGSRMWGHRQQDEHFVRCLLDGSQPCILPEDGRKAMQVAAEMTSQV
jgi:predicted dehydrogenase